MKLLNRFAVCALCVISVAGYARRNVVLIISDDQGLQAGCYGHSVIKTPNQDALAADGTIFSHAFATTASCSASRSVIMTGLHNHANGQFGHAHAYHDFFTHGHVRGVSRILAESPKKYRTGIVGKYHVQPKEVYPFEFERHTGVQARATSGFRNVAAMAGYVEEFLATDDERPFFLLVAYTDPHRGRGPGGFSNPPDGFEGVEPIEYDPAEVIVPAFLPDIPEVREELAHYYQAISRLDQGMGFVIEHIKSAGVYDETLIIYISDNGMPFVGAKTTVYDAGIRLPMIVRSPEQGKRGVRTDSMASWVDVTPTILDWTRVEAPYPLHGRSLLGALDAETGEGPDRVYASHTFHEITMYYPMRVVRTRSHKLILNIAHPLPYPFASDLYAGAAWTAVRAGRIDMLGRRSAHDYEHRPKWELYDLRVDPHEMNNRAADPEYAGVLAELKADLMKFQKRTKDPWVLKYEYE